MHSCQDCLNRLFSCHCRLFHHILCSISNFIIRYSCITNHTNVYRKQIYLWTLTHNRGAGSSFQKILCYNCSYFLSGLCHTFFHDTIICTHGYQCTILKFYLGISSNSGNPDHIMNMWISCQYCICTDHTLPSPRGHRFFRCKCMTTFF